MTTYNHLSNIIAMITLASAACILGQPLVLLLLLVIYREVPVIVSQNEDNEEEQQNKIGFV